MELTLEKKDVLSFKQSVSDLVKSEERMSESDKRDVSDVLFKYIKENS